MKVFQHLESRANPGYLIGFAHCSSLLSNKITLGAWRKDMNRSWVKFHSPNYRLHFSVPFCSFALTLVESISHLEPQAWL